MVNTSRINKRVQTKPRTSFTAAKAKVKSPATRRSAKEKISFLTDSSCSSSVESSPTLVTRKMCRANRMRPLVEESPFNYTLKSNPRRFNTSTPSINAKKIQKSKIKKVNKTKNKAKHSNADRDMDMIDWKNLPTVASKEKFDTDPFFQLPDTSKLTDPKSQYNWNPEWNKDIPWPENHNDESLSWWDNPEKLNESSFQPRGGVRDIKWNSHNHSLCSPQEISFDGTSLVNSSVSKTKSSNFSKDSSKNVSFNKAKNPLEVESIQKQVKISSPKRLIPTNPTQTKVEKVKSKGGENLNKVNINVNGVKITVETARKIKSTKKNSKLIEINEIHRKKKLAKNQVNNNTFLGNSFMKQFKDIKSIKELPKSRYGRIKKFKIPGVTYILNSKGKYEIKRIN